MALDVSNVKNYSENTSDFLIYTFVIAKETVAALCV